MFRGFNLPWLTLFCVLTAHDQDLTNGSFIIRSGWNAFAFYKNYDPLLINFALSRDMKSLSTRIKSVDVSDDDFEKWFSCRHSSNNIVGLDSIQFNYECKVIQLQVLKVYLVLKFDGRLFCWKMIRKICFWCIGVYFQRIVNVSQIFRCAKENYQVLSDEMRTK